MRAWFEQHLQLVGLDCERVCESIDVAMPSLPSLLAKVEPAGLPKLTDFFALSGDCLPFYIHDKSKFPYYTGGIHTLLTHIYNELQTERFGDKAAEVKKKIRSAFFENSCPQGIMDRVAGVVMELYVPPTMAGLLEQYREKMMRTAQAEARFEYGKDAEVHDREHMRELANGGFGWNVRDMGVKDKFEDNQASPLTDQQIARLLKLQSQREFVPSRLVEQMWRNLFELEDYGYVGRKAAGVYKYGVFGKVVEAVQARLDDTDITAADLFVAEGGAYQYVDINWGFVVSKTLRHFIKSGLYKAGDQSPVSVTSGRYTLTITPNTKAWSESLLIIGREGSPDQYALLGCVDVLGVELQSAAKVLLLASSQLEPYRDKIRVQLFLSGASPLVDDYVLAEYLRDTVKSYDDLFVLLGRLQDSPEKLDRCLRLLVSQLPALIENQQQAQAVINRLPLSTYNALPNRIWRMVAPVVAGREGENIINLAKYMKHMSADSLSAFLRVDCNREKIECQLRSFYQLKQLFSTVPKKLHGVLFDGLKQGIAKSTNSIIQMKLFLTEFLVGDGDRRCAYIEAVHAGAKGGISLKQIGWNAKGLITGSMLKGVLKALGSRAGKCLLDTRGKSAFIPIITGAAFEELRADCVSDVQSDVSVMRMAV